MALYQRRQIAHDSIVFGIDIEVRLGEFSEEFLEQRDRIALTGPDGAHFRPRQIGDRSGSVRDPVQGFVMEGNDPAVAGQMHIGFEIAVAHFSSRSECCERVLRSNLIAAAVSERLGLGTGKETRHTWDVSCHDCRLRGR